ncbi:hypothetical protein GGI20_001996 [Coemansia sp. BCRC 34301]|nr:hypothetical protein GGI20_001996 [Coemansia sp. BCRC 34301]
MTLSKTRPRQQKSAPDTVAAPSADSAAADSSPVDADIATVTTPKKQKQLLPRIVKQQPMSQNQQQLLAPFAPPPPPLSTNNECSLTRIIELYGEQTDILRLVLSAKSEEDRARAEYERRVQEELRYETRRLEFEMMLHSNYFKQQERDIQQQMTMAPPPHSHALVLHSPIGHSTAHHSVSQQQQQQQQQQQSTSGAHILTAPYPIQSGAHDPNSLRAYHHPDTPGGLDVRTNQHPFAFFKLPPGAPLHHPSAYSEQQHVPHSGGNINSGGSASSQMSSSRSQIQLSGNSSGNGPKAQQQQQQQLGIRERRPVPPAVSGLSVRILSRDHGLADAPRSAPVDGPDMKKRKISHDEVIMALRRKVMSKGGVGGGHALSQAQALTSAPFPAKSHSLQTSASSLQNSSNQRRSSLAVITHSGDEPCLETGVDDSSSSDSSSSSSPSPLASAVSSPLLRTADTEDRSQRVSSISLIVDADTSAASAAGSRPDVAA